MMLEWHDRSEYPLKCMWILYEYRLGGGKDAFCEYGMHTTLYGDPTKILEAIERYKAIKITRWCRLDDLIQPVEGIA